MVVTPESAFGLQHFAGEGKFHAKMYAEDDHNELHEDAEELEDAWNFIRFGEVPSDERRP